MSEISQLFREIRNGIQIAQIVSQRVCMSASCVDSGNFVKGAEMEQIIEMLAHIEMCVTGMTICTVIIMVMAILTAVNSFFDK